MTAPPRILDLVERFERSPEVYRSSQYNETQARHEFIDPFFMALGWDVNNEQGYAEPYKDVIHEAAVRVGGATKAPDYSFRIGGARKFFVEAKRPGIDLYDDPVPAFQLRRYAWSAKLPLSVLTDFDEFVVYDCRAKPKLSDKASAARVLYVPHTEYAERWDEIAGIFSREAVLKGSFDQYAAASRTKRGTAEVDTAFLQEIESWRDALARNIALRNPSLSQRELNYAVQMLIDRIIFLRIAEDRGIESYGQLQALLNGTQVYGRLLNLFRLADDRYNSGLFYFRPEKGRPETPDELSLNLAVDDKVLQDILRGLYYPNSPYEFSVLPADILGQVYEQFLGQVIRLTPSHRAVVEAKPEVKKAGGVYYTPTYIVDYIVQHTVGALLEDKTPHQAAGLRVLDPACGSGSFLLGAYQYLLDWYRDRYVADGPQKRAKGRAPTLYEHGPNDWRLTTAERKRILLDHIYGVDIDPQAVEVTKLSLLLKVLESESEQTLQPQLLHERALPDLGRNIKCGNSLIGSDYFQGQQMSFLEDEDYTRVNPFDWQAEFPEILAGGGFDCVIGNPPYGAFLDDGEKAYVRERFKSYRYKYDSYIYFIEKALCLVRMGGYVSYITPELWLRLENCQPLRKLISENAGFEILQICGESVFSQAVVNTIVFLLHRGAKADTLRVETGEDTWEIPSAVWLSSETFTIDYRLREGTRSLVAKIRSASSQPLSDFGEAIQGITPYDKYAGQDQETIRKRKYHSKQKLDDTYGKWLAGKDVTRFEVNWGAQWLSYGPWLAAPRDPRFFEGVRLLFREVPGRKKRIQATLTDETYYYGHSLTPFKPYPDNSVDARYLLGLVNSRLLSWYGGLVLPNFGKDIFPKLNPQDIKALPIRPIDFSDPTDANRHARMVELVERMLDLHRKLAAAKTPNERTRLQRQIEATDREIDGLVYELYELTAEEIKVVEEATQ